MPWPLLAALAAKVGAGAIAAKGAAGAAAAKGGAIAGAAKVPGAVAGKAAAAKNALAKGMSKTGKGVSAVGGGEADVDDAAAPPPGEKGFLPQQDYDASPNVVPNEGWGAMAGAIGTAPQIQAPNLSYAQPQPYYNPMAARNAIQGPGEFY